MGRRPFVLELNSFAIGAHRAPRHSKIILSQGPDRAPVELFLQPLGPVRALKISNNLLETRAHGALDISGLLLITKALWAFVVSILLLSTRALRALVEVKNYNLALK